MVVGAPNVTTQPTSTLTQAGAAYSYATANTTPLSVQHMTSASGSGSEKLGAAAALSPDGLKLVVGAPGHQSCGTTYLYTRTSTSVGFTTRATSVTTTALSGDNAGSSLAFGANSRLIVGNPLSASAGPVASGVATLVDLS